MAPRLDAAAQQALYRTQAGILVEASRSEREGFLRQLRAMVPAIGALGGDEALRKISLALVEVGAMWP